MNETIPTPYIPQKYRIKITPPEGYELFTPPKDLADGRDVPFGIITLNITRMEESWKYAGGVKGWHLSDSVLFARPIKDSSSYEYE
jgi:hypothetical protein